MSELHWTIDPDLPENRRAWAVNLNPTDKLPPYYRIVKAGGARLATRKVQLVTPRASVCGPSVTEIGPADNLAAAKTLAAAHYEREQGR